MGGFFGIASKENCVLDVFFGVDYHSHLGTKRAGMASYSAEQGFQRDIHNIENSPFRTKFAGITEEMSGRLCIGCISDTDPQPLLAKSRLGVYAISIVGLINNAQQLVDTLRDQGHNHFEAMGGGRVNTVELVAALISCRDSFAEGIRYAQSLVDGSLSVLLMTDHSIIAARDRLGRIP
ncbi:MAG: amidophosphoribosyltransferase, partial [Oscillospiraceae bacterium]|nr:amidophosphoribosyltransferase [Oscillospiraceae bacterium]